MILSSARCTEGMRRLELRRWLAVCNWVVIGGCRAEDQFVAMERWSRLGEVLEYR